MILTAFVVNINQQRGTPKPHYESGENEYSLAGLKKGDKVRLRIDLSSTAWDGVPALQTVVLEGASPIRWSTVEEWMKGSASNSLLIGL